MNHLKTALETYGLHKKQAAVYTALLSLGIASVAEIAKHSSLKRPTAYLIIDELIAKHLVTQIPKGKKVCYKAESPELLAEDLEFRRAALTEILPDLNTLFKANSTAPRIRFYEGKASLTKLYEEICRHKEVWSVFSPEKYRKIFSWEESKHIYRILDRHGGVIYDLCEDTPFTHKFIKETYRKGLSYTRLLPKSMKISTDILVYGNSVAMISLGTVVGVVIEDKSIAESQKLFIKHLWEEATDMAEV